VRFSDLDGRTIGVWGAGLETRSFGRHVAARLPRARVGVVVLEEAADAPELTEGASVVGATAAVEALAACDVLVRSPGVSIHRPELRALAARGLPITTPTGLWMAERGGRNVVGITATKGKSTTAALVAHLVKAAGVPVQLAGNIGRPALDLLDESDGDLAVVELSSYQTADLPIGPEVAMASNLYREHLNWHLTAEAYRHDKLRLLALRGVRRCVVNATSPEVMAAPRSCEDAWAFGTPAGWHVVDDGIAHRGDLAVPWDRLPLIGPHNALNACGALTALQALGLPVPPLPAAFDGFTGLAHRLQPVHHAEGVTWIDDSISTVPETAELAIESFPDRPIVLIGGGVDRGQDYSRLGRRLAERGALVLGVPLTGDRLVQAARDAGLPPTRALTVTDLPAAVAVAQRLATPGTVVLLSPAAPSFNAYRNFEARGDHFRDLVTRSA
jgi:UDP-N-acetylmuramoylalanine--D-glutamate ligase